MRLLVVGANGLLGSNVLRAAQSRNWPVSGTFHSTKPPFDVLLTQFDLRNHEAFDDVINEHNPDVVINCAAMTDVDACEAHPDIAHVINGEAPGRIAAQCAASEVAFVQISTDYVFDGSASAPYSESAETNPVQAYGESKRAGEQAVHSETTEAVVARLSFVWGIHRGEDTLTGFPAWVRDRLRSREEVPLFTDQRVTPTRAGQAAESLVEIIDRNSTGFFHVACTSCVTPYEFGEAVTDYVGNSTDQLKTASIADVDRDAVRPRYSCLGVNRVESTLGRPQPTLREDLETVDETLH